MKLAEVLWGPEVWCQGTIATQDGRRCLMGGLETITQRFGPDWDKNLTRLAGILGTTYVGVWNDSHTWDEVAAVVEEYDRLTMLEEG